MGWVMVTMRLRMARMLVLAAVSSTSLTLMDVMLTTAILGMYRLCAMVALLDKTALLKVWCDARQAAARLQNITN